MERESEAQQEFQSLVDELKNKVSCNTRYIHVYVFCVKNLEEKHALSSQRKAVLDELWDKFQKVILYIEIDLMYILILHVI